MNILNQRDDLPPKLFNNILDCINIAIETQTTRTGSYTEDCVCRWFRAVPTPDDVVFFIYDIPTFTPPKKKDSHKIRKLKQHP